MRGQELGAKAREKDPARAARRKVGQLRQGRGPAFAGLSKLPKRERLKI